VKKAQSDSELILIDSWNDFVTILIDEDSWNDCVKKAPYVVIFREEETWKDSVKKAPWRKLKWLWKECIDSETW
jgi:hypothetical protein